MAISPRLEIAEEGYCYPRFLSRLAAASIDLAFAVAAAILIYIFSFANSWYPNLGDALGINKANEEIYRIEKDSKLFKVADDGALSYFEPTQYEGFEEPIKDFYFVYNQEGSTCPEPAKYTVKDYNVDILDLPSDPTRVSTSKYFKFSIDGEGHVEENQFGLLKDELFDEHGNLTAESRRNLLSFFKDKYYATIDVLAGKSYFSSREAVISSGMTWIELLSLGLPFLVFYFLIPMFSRYGATLGKKIMKLALVSTDGHRYEKYQIALRSIPFVATLAIFLLLDQIIYSISLFVIVFMVSFGCAVFTKRKKALHDFVANTVVTRLEDAEAIERISNKEASNEENR